MYVITLARNKNRNKATVYSTNKDTFSNNRSYCHVRKLNPSIFWNRANLKKRLWTPIH
jgi:hypothetical protein